MMNLRNGISLAVTVAIASTISLAASSPALACTNHSDDPFCGTGDPTETPTSGDQTSGGSTTTESRIFFTTGRTGNDEIFSMKSDGTDAKNLTNNSASDALPDVAKDGSLVAFTSKRNGNYDIFTVNSSGGELKRLTTSSYEEIDPALSPDKKRIVFIAKVDGQYDLYVMNSDGTGKKRLTNDTYKDSTPTWKPDGSKILFSSARPTDTDAPGYHQLWIIKPDGTGANVLFDNYDYWQGNEYAPEYSPNGQQIVFVSDGQLICSAWDGESGISLTWSEDYDSPTWSPDGKKIAFHNYKYNSVDRTTDNEIGTINPDGDGETYFLDSGSSSDTYPSW